MNIFRAMMKILSPVFSVFTYSERPFNTNTVGRYWIDEENQIKASSEDVSKQGGVTFTERQMMENSALLDCTQGTPLSPSCL